MVASRKMKSYINNSSRRLKVILATRAVYHFHGYGGMQLYYYNLGKFLAKQGINVEIIASLDKTRKRFAVPYSGHQTSGSIGQKHRFLSRDFYYLEKENPMHYRISNKVDLKVLRIRYLFSTKEIKKISLWGPFYWLIGTIIQDLLNSSFITREGYELCWGFIFPLREFEITLRRR